MREEDGGLHEGPATAQQLDEGRLARYGYQQELRRDWGLVHNFGVSFSMIGIIVGITTMFSYGLHTGGPAVMSIGWIVLSGFTFFVALAMADIVSAIPTSGGPYVWAAVLTPPRWSPFAAWITGWYSLLAHVAITAGAEYGLAGFIADAVAVKNPGYAPTPGHTIAISTAILASHCVVNSLGVRVLRYLTSVSVALQSVGVASLAIAVIACAPTRQPASFVFGTFNDSTGVDGAPGWSQRASRGYVAMCGALMAQYSLLGFDASAHLSEETINAAWAAPIAVVSSAAISAVFGFLVLLAFLFSIQDFDRTLNANQPVLQILLDVFGENGGLAAFGFIIVCVWITCLFCMTSNSRMAYSFARDGGIPSFFHAVEGGRVRSPVRAVVLIACLAFVLILPSLHSQVALAAATSIATIGFYISFGIPTLASVVWHERFVAIRGPFSLGAAGRPVALVTVGWIICVTVAFCLPTVNPVTDQTLNYAPAAVIATALLATAVWALWANRWFTGPTIEPADVATDAARQATGSARSDSEAKPASQGVEVQTDETVLV